jgi:hypothetical protein
MNNYPFDNGSLSNYASQVIAALLPGILQIVLASLKEEWLRKIDLNVLDRLFHPR